MHIHHTTLHVRFFSGLEEQVNGQRIQDFSGCHAARNSCQACYPRVLQVRKTIAYVAVGRAPEDIYASMFDTV